MPRKGNRFSIYGEGAETTPDDIPVIEHVATPSVKGETKGPVKSNMSTARSIKSVPASAKSRVNSKVGAEVVAQNFLSVATPGSILSKDGQISPLDIYFVDFDIDGAGLQIYRQATASHRIAIISRLTIGTIAAALSFVGLNRIRQIISSSKVRSGVSKRRASGAAKRVTKQASRFAYYSGKARSVISRAGIALKGAPKSLPMWIISAGTGVISSVTITKDIGQWFADAISDWQQTFRYNFGQDFSSADFARLNAILTAGQEARFQKDRNGIGVAVSGRDIKLLTILASTSVMDIPIDIRTSAVIGDTLKTVLDLYEKSRRNSSSESLDAILNRVRMTIHIGDPDNPRASKAELEKIATEFRQLLFMFDRSITDVRDWDNEDILVPIALIVNRFVKVPGILSKIVANAFSFGEVALTKTFDEETHELVAQIDAANSINRNDSGFFEYLKNFVLYKLGFNMEGQSGNIQQTIKQSGDFELPDLGGI